MTSELGHGTTVIARLPAERLRFRTPVQFAGEPALPLDQPSPPRLSAAS